MTPQPIAAVHCLRPRFATSKACSIQLIRRHYAKLDRNETAELRTLASANTRIRISSNLPGLLAHMGDVSIHSETRLRSSEIRYRGNGEPFPPTVTVHNPAPVAQRILPDRRELYMNTPQARQWSGNLRDSSLHHEWRVRAQLRLALDTGDPVPHAVRTANTVIRIETHLPGLLGTQEGGSICAECRLRSTETLYQHGPTIMAPDIMETDLPTTQTVTPLAQIAWPGSLTLYVHTPESRSWTGNTRDSSLHHEWGVRVQATLELPDDTFPAPSPKTPRRDAASQAFSAQPEVFYSIKPALEL